MAITICILLFSLPEKAESLPPSERHAYAERMAISFWQAVGGDTDEISGLVDSD